MERKVTFKILKIGGIVLFSIFLLLAAGLIYLDRNIENIAAQFLEKEYRQTEYSKVYEIQYSNIKLSLFTGFLIVENIIISPRESFFTSADSLRFKYPLLYKIEMPELSVSGLSENFSLTLKNIQLNKIILSRPTITMIDHLSKVEKSKLKAEGRKTDAEGNARNLSGFESFALSGFKVIDGSFGFFNRNQNKTVVKAGKINIEINNLELSPGHILKTLVNETFESAYLSLAGITFPVDGGFYNIEIGEVLNNVGDKKIKVNDLKLIPQFEKPEFANKFGKQTDRMELDIARLEIEGFDIEKAILGNEIFVNNIFIDDFFLNAYRDKNIPFDFNRFPKLPQQELAMLSVALNIGKIEIRNSEVVYEQLAEGSQTPGIVPIKNLKADLTNISNIDSVIKIKGSMKWDIHANLFDAGLLEVQIFFDRNIHKPDFSFKGKMGEMDMTAFNSMLVNTENLRIEHGYLKSMTFDAVAYENYAEGELVMKYDSLKITGLKKFSEEEREELGFLSALANVVIRNFNPPKKSREEPVPVSIFFERDTNKGIFNYLAKSLISGVKATIIPSIGSPKKKYEKEKAKEQRQEEKLSKKEARKQKREEKSHKKN